MEDAQIIDLFWARKEQAISETSEKYGIYCFSIAKRILSSEEDAQESVNDTWLAAWNTMPPHRPSILSVFLGKITRRISIDRWRKNTAGKRGGGQVECALDELEYCISESGEPDREVDRIVLTDILNRFLSGLSKDARIIFLQRYWYLLSIRDIAVNLGISESKVKTSLMRSRQRLKEMLKVEGIWV